MKGYKARKLRALAWLFALGCGARTPFEYPDGFDAQTRCLPSQTRCGLACVDLTSDFGNCGACGHTCGGATVCSLGMCLFVDTRCAAGQIRCAGGCVDAQDRRNCGACGHDCGPGGVCSMGVCSTSECFAPRITCGGACVDPMTNDAHCGACGRACAMTQHCRSGSCVDRAGCMPGQTDCGFACADLTTDHANCGACSVMCPVDQTCTDGVCHCPGTTYQCAAHCVDRQTDASHCGMCDNVCAGGARCVAGVCAMSGGPNWSVDAGSPGDDVGLAIAVDVDGNVYATGRFQGTIRFGGDTLTSAGSSDGSKSGPS